jgi:hypothetical protein
VHPPLSVSLSSSPLFFFAQEVNNKERTKNKDTIALKRDLEFLMSVSLSLKYFNCEANTILALSGAKFNQFKEKVDFRHYTQKTPKYL